MSISENEIDQKLKEIMDELQAVGLKVTYLSRDIHETYTIAAIHLLKVTDNIIEARNIILRMINGRRLVAAKDN